VPDAKAPSVPTREELLRRAEALVPVLRERSDACEAARCCPAETVRDFKEAGLVRVCQPARYGGYEMGWDVRSEICEVLARGCASQAWIHHILTDHTQKLGAFDIRAQADVWGEDPDTRIAAGLDPVGKARPVPGGVTYGGRHGFSSGIDHAQWLICGGHIYADGKPPQRAFFLVPKSEATIIDDWHVMGLAGTGSKSFEVKECFVPAHRIIDAADADDARGPGVAINRAPVFRMPFTTVAATGFAAIAVGIAQGFLADWTDYTKSRTTRGTPVAGLMGTQIDLGHAAVAIDAARRMYLGAAQEAMAALAQSERLTDAQRLEARLAASFAAQHALAAVQHLFNAAGCRVLYTRNILQRRLRDLQAASAHISVASNTATSAYGGFLLGAGAIDPITARGRLPH